MTDSHTCYRDHHAAEPNCPGTDDDFGRGEKAESLHSAPAHPPPSPAAPLEDETDGGGGGDDDRDGGADDGGAPEEPQVRRPPAPDAEDRQVEEGREFQTFEEGANEEKSLDLQHFSVPRRKF